MKKITLNHLTRELIAAQADYLAARNHFASCGKLSKWERECRYREKERYRRVLALGIKYLSEELNATLDEGLPPTDIPSAIEQDIADEKSLDLPSAE